MNFLVEALIHLTSKTRRLTIQNHNFWWGQIKFLRILSLVLVEVKFGTKIKNPD